MRARDVVDGGGVIGGGEWRQLDGYRLCGGRGLDEMLIEDESEQC